jgi:hypothetical protein
VQHVPLKSGYGAGLQDDQGEVQPAGAQVVSVRTAGATAQLDLDAGMVSGERGEDAREADLRVPLCLEVAMAQVPGIWPLFRFRDGCVSGFGEVRFRTVLFSPVRNVCRWSAPGSAPLVIGE